MKKTILTFAFIIALYGTFSSCQKEATVDKEKPVIDLSAADAFPGNCDTLYFGEPFVLKMAFSDNVELGSYSIDIHHNFDHHSHSTEITSCTMDPIKEAFNSFTHIQNYSIPTGQQHYQTQLSIPLPTSNDDGSFDEGDYHFYISLTDHEGWSTQKGLSIKILYR
jgi:hypothetical protein